MIKFPSINQYRDVVKHVQSKTQFVGLDSDGKVIFDRNIKLPKLKFRGTVKCHGSNGSVCYGSNGDMWVQSRERVITPMSDNAGFAQFVESKRIEFDKIHRAIANNVECKSMDIVIYGEWCGGSIQKGVALNQLPKMFIVFDIAIVDADGNRKYLDEYEIFNVFSMSLGVWKNKVDAHIFSIYDFPTYSVEIDFENPHESQNRLNEIALNIEELCPVGDAFGVSGIGEGAVFTCIEPGYEDSGFWFKVKGTKHSNSKVKTLATVDVERINNIKVLAEHLANTGRLNQGLDVVFGFGEDRDIDVKRMSEYIQWVMRDIVKECLDLIDSSGFTVKEVSGPISKIARNFVLNSCLL